MMAWVCQTTSEWLSRSNTDWARKAMDSNHCEQALEMIDAEDTDNKKTDQRIAYEQQKKMENAQDAKMNKHT